MSDHNPTARRVRAASALARRMNAADAAIVFNYVRLTPNSGESEAYFWLNKALAIALRRSEAWADVGVALRVKSILSEVAASYAYIRSARTEVFLFSDTSRVTIDKDGYHISAAQAQA